MENESPIVQHFLLVLVLSFPIVLPALMTLMALKAQTVVMAESWEEPDTVPDTMRCYVVVAGLWEEPEMMPDTMRCDVVVD